MTTPTTRDIGADGGPPIPMRQLRWYMLFWHVVYLGMLGVWLYIIVSEAWPNLGWREAALAGLLALQAALYVGVFVRVRCWPLPAWQLAAYFLGSLAVWFVEWRLDERFFWVVLTYMGQMFGVLPPVAAIPGVSAIYLLVMGHSNNWDFSGWTMTSFLGTALGWVSFIVVYLFIWSMSRTSDERARLILQLETAQRELEAARQRDTELAALRERERLARDLHDSLGHALVAISVQLEAIKRLYRVDPARGEAQVEALAALARGSMDELRRSLQALRAPGLGERPLAEALQSLAVAAGERAGLEVACRVEGDPARLPPNVAEALWRVAQEALTNVEKHARARRVDVSLSVSPAAAVLCVADDGLGLPPGAGEQPERFGLRGMRERLEGVGGTLVLNGGPGARVEARVPL